MLFFYIPKIEVHLFVGTKKKPVFHPGLWVWLRTTKTKNWSTENSESISSQAQAGNCLSERVAAFCNPSGDKGWCGCSWRAVKAQGGMLRVCLIRVRGHHRNFCVGGGCRGCSSGEERARRETEQPKSSRLAQRRDHRPECWTLDTGRSGPANCQHIFIFF